MTTADKLKNLRVPSLADVEAARSCIAAMTHVTPVAHSSHIDRLVGKRVVFKCENMQKTGSFKSRGALNAVMNLSDAERRAGVVTVSAGNHAQALAWAAAIGGAPCTVVMPATASRSKVEASEGYGATVVFEQGSLAAFERAKQIASEDGFTLVHPFDDTFIAAGAGTIALELLEQSPDIECVVVPIGGGGLIAGIAAAIKESAPHVNVYGVEPVGAAAMYESVSAGHPVRLAAPPKTVADGLAAPMAGELTYEAVRKYVDGVVLVDDESIMNAMRLVVSRTKLLTEPAGAAAFAAIQGGLIPASAGTRIAAILSGGNVDLERLVE